MSETTITWYRPGKLPPSGREELAGLYTRIAGDFFPPLTARSGTTQTELRELEPASDTYFAQMLAQDLLICRRGDLAGFISFVASHTDENYEDLCPCIYVSTIAVSPDHRRAGIARLLYRHLFDLPVDLPRSVVLRTWSTNASHISLLGELGFSEFDRLSDARAPGVHTLYFVARRKVPAALC